MKSYTDLEQSKRLAEILPIESADMYYFVADNLEKQEINYAIRCGIPIVKTDIPCWSLVALLNAVDFNTINLHYDNAKIDWVASATIHDNTKYCTKYESTRALNPIDACVEMIIKLHELNLM